MARRPDRKPPPSLADEAEQAYAAAALLERLAPLEREADGVRSGADIEHLHRMRVASRRLRTALRVFADCLPRRPLPVWQREIRRITRALGDARDLDVQFEFLSGCFTTRLRPAYRPGLARLQLRLAQRRAKLQERVERRLDEFESRRIAESLRDRLSERANLDARSTALLRRAGREISLHLDELLEFRRFVDKPRCARELHQMRIAAKHLRYSMELFRPLFTDGLGSYLEAAKSIQQKLGDLHDADVWRELLPDYAREERDRTICYCGNDRPFLRLKPGFAWLERRVTTLRRGHYRAFAAVWSGCESAGTWEGLGTAIAARPVVRV